MSRFSRRRHLGHYNLNKGLLHRLWTNNFRLWAADFPSYSSGLFLIDTIGYGPVSVSGTAAYIVTIDEKIINSQNNDKLTTIQNI